MDLFSLHRLPFYSLPYGTGIEGATVDQAPILAYIIPLFITQQLQTTLTWAAPHASENQGEYAPGNLSIISNSLLAPYLCMSSLMQGPVSSNMTVLYTNQLPKSDDKHGRGAAINSRCSKCSQLIYRLCTYSNQAIEDSLSHQIIDWLVSATEPWFSTVTASLGLMCLRPDDPSPPGSMIHQSLHPPLSSPS